jgi:RNA 2',3'-cyclic 3'-phosphodiesterase
MENKRVFLAVNLPEQIKNEIIQEQKEIDNSFPEEYRKGLIRWTKKENIHITLFFLGNLEEKEILALSKRVKEIIDKQNQFYLELSKIDYGPPAKMPPRMIWLQLKNSLTLNTITEEIKKTLFEKKLLKRPEERSFTPHITLGRIKIWQWKRIEPEERPVIKKTLDQNFPVKSIELMESKLKRTGAEYQILESFPLS